MPRLFIAAWPDSVVCAQLAEYSAKCEWANQAKPVTATDFHLTLRFVGEVDFPMLNTIRESLALDFAPIDLELGRPQLWEEVAVLRPISTSTELTALHDSIEEKLGCLGLTADRRGYRPHVTLAHRAKHSRLPQSNVIAWRINAFCLVESIFSSAGRYRILHTYLAH